MYGKKQRKHDNGSFKITNKHPEKQEPIQRMKRFGTEPKKNLSVTDHMKEKIRRNAQTLHNSSKNQWDKKYNIHQYQ